MVQLFNPMLSKLIYETVKITQEMILYSSSDLCAMCEGPHPLLNMESYIKTHDSGSCGQVGHATDKCVLYRNQVNAVFTHL